MKVSWGYEIPNIRKNKKNHGPVTTNQINVYETTLPTPFFKHAVGDRGQQTTVPSRHGFKRSDIGTLCGPVNLGAVPCHKRWGPRMASNIHMSYVKNMVFSI